MLTQWRRRGSICTQEKRVVVLGDRPSPRPGPANGQGLSGRQRGSRGHAGAPSRALWSVSSRTWSARFAEDSHVWASALYDEVVELGYACSYPSFARQVRLAGLRPHCEACSGVAGRETIEIGHPAGEEVQWDWFERRKSPWGGHGLCPFGHPALLGA